jgi:hypothetical protein
MGYKHAQLMIRLIDDDTYCYPYGPSGGTISIYANRDDVSYITLDSTGKVQIVTDTFKTSLYKSGSNYIFEPASTVGSTNLYLKPSGAGGYVKFGRHTLAALVPTGYIQIRDESDNIRRLLVG